MIHPMHILALSDRRMWSRQIDDLFCGGRCQPRLDGVRDGRRPARG